ncbi:MAG: nitroreductase family protein [Pseudomonadales bacterium]|nr:nitroreductase family protein [Pseudomonadales bacterium]
MELFEVMRTTFAAREFTGEPVPDEVLYRILDNARFAPSGGNRQGWKVIVVRERATRDALVPLITPVVRRYRAEVAAGESPYNTINASQVTDEDVARTSEPTAIVRNLVDAPVLLFVFVDLSLVASFDRDVDHVGVISGASIYPFVWNILLAARHEGYGGTPTTFVGANEAELKSLLDVPDNFAFATMIPMGKPVKQLTKLRRKSPQSFAVLERFEGKPLEP